MVTRRAVLKGAAAASIGAIAAAHGAAPAEAASFLDLGYGQLTGGAIGGFVKQPDAFQIAVKFDEAAAEVFFKEQLTGGIAVFFKFFNKGWSTVAIDPIDSKYFPDLKTSALYFSKIHAGGAKLFLKNEVSSVVAEIETSPDEVFFKYDVFTND